MSLNPTPPAPQSEDLVLEAAGLRLVARRLSSAGSAAAPAIVLLHEALGSIGQWKAFPERLAAASGLPVLIYERQGHGGSPPLGPPRDPDYLRHEAETVLPAVLAAAGIVRPVLLGHSDGATIALMFAAAFPKAVAACIALAPHVMVEEITLAGIRTADAEPGAGQVRERLAKYHGDKTDDLWRAWADTWLSPGFDGCDIRAELPEITTPTPGDPGRRGCLRLPRTGGRDRPPRPRPCPNPFAARRRPRPASGECGAGLGPGPDLHPRKYVNPPMPSVVPRPGRGRPPSRPAGR